jgi:hypothetical protein
MARAHFDDVDLECEVVIAVDDEADQDRQVKDLVGEPNLPEHQASSVSAILFILLIVVVSSGSVLVFAFAK